MKEFIDKNKLAVILFLIFSGLAVLSGWYLKTNSASQNIPFTKAVAMSQTASEIVNPSEPKNTASTSAAKEVVGEPYVLLVGDQRYDINLPAGKTVYDLMLALKNRGAFDFQGKASAGLGFFVEEINGVKNNPLKNKFWLYYVNGKTASVGISNYVLTAKDVISWRYESPQF